MTGNEFKAAREASGLTQEQAGEYLGIDRTTIWNYENSSTIPTRAEFFIEYLVPGHERLEAFVGRLTLKQKRAVQRRRSNAEKANNS